MCAQRTALPKGRNFLFSSHAYFVAVKRIISLIIHGLLRRIKIPESPSHQRDAAYRALNADRSDREKVTVYFVSSSAPCRGFLSCAAITINASREIAPALIPARCVRARDFDTCGNQVYRIVKWNFRFN